MGSLKIASDTPRSNMSPFKATLWLSVLTLSLVRAAPVELVAGRVVTHEPVTQNLGFVGDIHSLRSLFANGIPAGISLVRTVPQHTGHVTHAVPSGHVTHTTGHVAVPASLNTVRTVPVSHSVATSVPVSHSVAHHVVRTPTTASVVPAAAVVHHPVSHVAVPHAVHHPVAPVPAVSAVAPAVESVKLATPAVVSTPVVSQRLTPVIQEEDLLPANYNFGYSVSDLVSGDSKTRQESRDGDVVTGSYSVADPDGRIRTVTYTADSVHGFQAKVTYDGEEGPVAIPFNPPPTPVNIVANAPGPAPINVVAQAPAPAPAPFPAPITPPAPVATPATEEVIIAKDAPAPASPTTLTTSAPVTTPVTAPQPLTFPSRALPAVPETPASTIRTAPRLLNAFPQVDLNQLIRVLNHNDVHALHNLPGGVTTVRTGAGAPVDLSQFTFLSGGQVLV